MTRGGGTGSRTSMRSSTVSGSPADELLPLLAVGPEQAGLRDPRLAAAVLAQAGRALLGVTLLGEQRVVAGDRLLRGAVELDAAVAEEDRAAAEALDRRRRRARRRRSSRRAA